MPDINPDELRRIFDLAFDAPLKERTEILQRECGRDIELQRRVEAMIAAAQDTRFLNAATLHDGARATTSAAEQPGIRIGPYKLLQQIGEGGFGLVFMAEQEKPVQRKVALKIIKLGMDTRQVVARFEQERQALALMDHPHVARVFDAGSTDTGRPFFVMELCTGEAITSYCDKHNLSILQRLNLFVQICQAVQHAHQKGLIHRDIKPSNVLVSTQDSRPFAKIIDFGVAKATASRLTEKTLFTEHKQIIGTPEYMSPEQAEGSLDIDTRTDVYSLGVLLYELLTGSTPFDSRSLRSAAFGEIQRIIREVEPPKPSTRLAQSSDTIASIAARRDTEPRKLGTLVRGELDWIVMKAMEKDRQRRYESANALGADIQRYLTGEAVNAAPPSRSYLLRKFVRRNKVPVAAISAVLCASLLGLLAFAWQANVARQERDRAVAAEAETAKRVKEVEQIAAFQSSMLSQIDPTRSGQQLMADLRARLTGALEKRSVPAEERERRIGAFAQELLQINATDTATEMIDATILKPSISAITKQFADQPLVDATLRNSVAELYKALGITNAALPLQQAALSIRRRVLGETHRDTLMSMNNLATIFEAAGRTAEAEQLYRDTLAGRRKALGDKDADTLQSMGNLGNLLRAKAQYAEAEPLLRGALEGYRKVLGNDHRETLTALNTMGFFFVSQGRPALAEPLWREAYERGRKTLGEENREVLVWLNNLGGLLQSQGKLTEASPYLRESFEKHRRVLGEEHPRTLMTTTIFAGHLRRRGMWQEAEGLYREAIEKSRRVLGPEHPDTLLAMSGLATVLILQARHAEAEAHLRETLAAHERVFGAEHPRTLGVVGQLARELEAQDRSSDAEAAYRQVVEAFRRTLGPESTDTLIAMKNLGAFLVKTGRSDEAEEVLRQTLQIRRQVTGEEDVETLITQYVLVKVLMKKRQLNEAESLCRDVLVKQRKVIGNEHSDTLSSMRDLAEILRALGKADQAEPLNREEVETSQRVFGRENARTAVARISFGLTLIANKNFAQAELELLESHRVHSMTGSPGNRKTCIESIIRLYDEWNKAEPGKGYDQRAEEWK